MPLTAAEVAELVAIEAEVERRRHQADAALLRVMLAAPTPGNPRLPANATRELLDHEDRAAVNFASIDDDAAATARRLGDRLKQVNREYVDAVGAYAAELARNNDIEAGYRLFDLLYAWSDPANPVPRAAVRALRAEHGSAIGAELAALHVRAVERVRAEAAAQGILTDGLGPVELDDAQRAAYDRMAEAKVGDVVRETDTALGRAPAIGVDEDPDAAIARVTEAGTLKQSTTDGLAEPLTTTVEGNARQAALAELPQPSAIYASELLDRSTCAPCSVVDGREYPNLAAARVDYPSGNYIDCAGGERCRGTLVFVWDEADAEPPPGERDPRDGAPGPTSPRPPAPGASPARPPASRPEWVGEVDALLADLDLDVLDTSDLTYNKRGRIEGGKLATLAKDGETLMPTERALATEAKLRAVGAVVERRARAQVGELAERADVIEATIPEIVQRRDAVTAKLNELRRQPASRGRDRELDKLIAEQREVVMEQVTAQAAAKAAREEAREALARARVRALEDVRPMGGRVAVDDARSVIEGADAAQDAAGSYPTSWVQRSNAQGRLRVGWGDDRGYYRTLRNGDGELQIGPAGGRQLAVHEFGHRMEAVTPRLGLAQWVMLRRRATGPRGGLEKLTAIYRGTRERGRRDKWFRAYTGKEYGDGTGIDPHYELFTTGVESVLGWNRTDYTEGDRELIEFVLGVLAGIP